MRVPAIVLGFVLVIAAACSNPVDNDPLASLGEEVRSIDIDHVVATDWEADSIESNGEVLFTFDDDSSYTLLPEDGRAGGSANVNSWWASFRVDNESFIFSDLAATLRGVPDLDRWGTYIDVLKTADVSGMEDERLVIQSTEKDKAIFFLPSE